VTICQKTFSASSFPHFSPKEMNNWLGYYVKKGADDCLPFNLKERSGFILTIHLYKAH